MRLCVKSVTFYFSNFTGPAQRRIDSRHLIYAFEPENACSFWVQADRSQSNQESKGLFNISPLELMGPLRFAFMGKLVRRTHSNFSQQIIVVYSQLLFRSLANITPASHLGANRKD